MDIKTFDLPLICSLVNESERVALFPRYTGSHFSMVENLIYEVLNGYMPLFSGAQWVFWELSNGSFYIAPARTDESCVMRCEGYSGTMSADAAGIVVCLVAFHRMAWNVNGAIFNHLFYGLRAWAETHPEAEEIRAATLAGLN